MTTPSGGVPLLMGSFTVQRHIEAPVGRVWEALAEIGSIHVWNPGVHNSYVTSCEPTGLGSSRHCDLGGRNYLKEEVVEFDDGKRLTMRIVETTLPFETADIRFHLLPDKGGTTVTVEPVYGLKFGPAGSLLDRLFVRRTYTKGMVALLGGLKDHVEGTT